MPAVDTGVAPVAAVQALIADASDRLRIAPTVIVPAVLSTTDYYTRATATSSHPRGTASPHVGYLGRSLLRKPEAASIVLRHWAPLASQQRVCLHCSANPPAARAPWSGSASAIQVSRNRADFPRSRDSVRLVVLFIVRAARRSAVYRTYCGIEGPLWDICCPPDRCWDVYDSAAQATSLRLHDQVARS